MTNKAKKIAVIVRDRQSEALRMALGLTLVDDIIDVYMLDRKFEGTEQDALNLELMKEMDMNFYTNMEGDKDMKHLPIKKITHKLLEYDHVLPY